MLLFVGIYQRWIDPCKWKHNTAGKVISSSAALGKRKKRRKKKQSLWPAAVLFFSLKKWSSHADYDKIALADTFWRVTVSFSWKCPFEYDQRRVWVSCCRSDETTWASSQVEKATCVMDDPSCHLCMTDIKGQQAASHKAAKSQHRLIELEQCP